MDGIHGLVNCSLVVLELLVTFRDIARIRPMTGCFLTNAPRSIVSRAGYDLVCNGKKGLSYVPIYTLDTPFPLQTRSYPARLTIERGALVKKHPVIGRMRAISRKVTR